MNIHILTLFQLPVNILPKTVSVLSVEWPGSLPYFLYQFMTLWEVENAVFWMLRRLALLRTDISEESMATNSELGIKFLSNFLLLLVTTKFLASGFFPP
jgi:hypothetical protein